MCFFLWHAHVCLCVCMCAHRCLKKPEEDGVSGEVGIAGGYEPPDMGAGKQTLVLCALTCWAIISLPSISFYFILLSVYNLMFFRFGEKRPEDRNPLWMDGYFLDHYWFSFWSLLRPHGRKLLVLTYCYLPETILFCRDLHCFQIDLNEVTENEEKTDII